MAIALTSCLTHLRSALSQNIAQSGKQLLWVVCSDRAAGDTVVHHFATGVGRSGQNRLADAHRLEIHQSKPLAARREAEGTARP